MQYSSGLWHVHQNEPPNDGINLLRESQFVDVADEERNLRETCCLRTSLRNLQHARIRIHANDTALLTYQLGGKQAYISRSTTHIKHVHPGSQASILQQAPRERIEELTLYQ